MVEKQNKKILWSNCVIEAFKRKFRNWNNIVLMPVFRLPWHFHLMWFDKDKKEVRHFTHRSMEGWHSDVFFKGQVETIKLKHFRDWCITVGKPNSKLIEKTERFGGKYED